MSKHAWSKAPKLALWSGEGEGNGRTYVNPVDDSRHPSVTTILKNTPKADLMGWSAFKVAEVAIERYADLGGDPEQVMKWLPYAHTDYRNERGWVLGFTQPFRQSMSSRGTSTSLMLNSWQ